MFNFFFQLNFTLNDFPRPWQLSFQKPATSMMEGIIDLHHDILTFLLIILIFVSFLFLTIFVRFIDRSQVSKTQKNFSLMQFQNGHGITHHTTLEIVWTLVPTLILLFIATPSFALIYALDEIVEPDLTLRVVGRQWYWTYEFPDVINISLPFMPFNAESSTAQFLMEEDSSFFSKILIQSEKYRTLLQPLFNNNLVQKHLFSSSRPDLTFAIPGFTYNSYIIPAEDLFAGSFRLLEVDRRLVLPVQTNIRVLVTSYDVIHSWTVPAFGIKVDALPGRLNEYFLNVNYLGIFYGQCSEICGVNHGFMPIKVEIETTEQFKWWFFCSSLIENSTSKFRNSWNQ
jgi:cytochrome c oxidase subunit 2